MKHGRVHSSLNPVSQISGDGQHFNAIAELSGEADILRDQILNALPVNVIKRDGDAVYNGYKNSQFMSRVRTIHIEGRGVLGISEFNGSTLPT